MQSQQYAAHSAGKYYKYFKYQCKLHLKYTLTCAFYFKYILLYLSILSKSYLAKYNCLFQHCNNTIYQRNAFLVLEYRYIPLKIQWTV